MVKRLIYRLWVCALITGGACSFGCVAVPTGLGNNDGSCSTGADCEVGEACNVDTCEAFAGPDVKLWAAPNGVVAPVPEGGGIPVFRGFQGGTHTLITLRTRDLPTSEVLSSEITVTMVPSGVVLNLVIESNVFIADLDDDLGEAEDVFVALDFGTIDTAAIAGQEAIVAVTLTSQSDASITASLEQQVRFTDGGAG